MVSLKNKHTYILKLNWIGNQSVDSLKNDRLYEISIPEKEKFLGSADKVFYGDETLYNPEDLLLSALTACHMMSYLYLCRKKGIKVKAYTDQPEGRLKVNPDGSGQFEQVVLRPQVSIVNEEQKQQAQDLHQEAGKLCFIARSCNFTIIYEPQIDVF